MTAPAFVFSRAGCLLLPGQMSNLQAAISLGDIGFRLSIEMRRER